MHLGLLDWLIVLATLFICFFPALFFGKRAGKNTSEFFVSGRSVPWWLAGLSMVATTFSSDTPDLEFYEIRYSGKAASFVRGFRSIYLGLVFNSMIMATVTLAACKIAAILFG